ncbi:MAG TPA: ABC transporter permease [Bryobacteraceae bacterium]
MLAAEERRQFRILFRTFLSRMIDVELLSTGGDVGKLMAQMAALLAAFSFTFVVASAQKYMASSLPQPKLLATAQVETEFLFATTMAVACMIAVMVWNAVLPERRDCIILGVLPIRRRTIFFARFAAVAAAVGTAVLATNIFTGLCYPFLLLSPGATFGTAARSFLAYWLAMAATGVVVCSTLLAVQGICSLLLSHRRFLRFSSWMQLAAFFVVLATYFLKPGLPLRLSPGSLSVSWVPSFWFYALFERWSGTASPVLMPYAGRALWWLFIGTASGALAFTLAFNRIVRRINEQPDIIPGDRFHSATRFGRSLTARVFAHPLDRAIVLFTARTLARSRQHRLLLAAFGGVGLAIALVYAKDLIYGYSGGLFDSLGLEADANLHWGQANIPFLVASLILLAFGIFGVRAVFSLPTTLRANWIFRITTIHNPSSYFAAVRKALYLLTAIPISITAATVLLLIWPTQQALEHVAVMAALGVLLVEISLHRFSKIPFACSYLPGKTNMNVRFGAYALLFLFITNRGAAIEYAAIQHGLGLLVLLALLVLAAVWAQRRTARFMKARGNRLQFEDALPPEVAPLDLRHDGVLSGAWMSEEAPSEEAPNAHPIHLEQEMSKKSATTLIGLNLDGAPVPVLTKEPRLPIPILIEQLIQDLRQGVRIVRHAPAFSAVTILLIALGLGANLTLYSIIHSVLSKPAPGVKADGLVAFSESIDGELLHVGPLNSYPNYLDMLAQSRTMRELTASVAAPFLVLKLPDATYEVRGEVVSANYFQTLGVPLMRGRSFTESESRGAGGLTAVIAYHIWQNQFHGSENIIGQHIEVDGHPATVIGVTTEGFHGTGLAPQFEIGLPLPAYSRLNGTEPHLLDRAGGGVSILGRLAPGVGLSQAQAEFGIISGRLRAAYPHENRGWAAVLAPYSMTIFGPNSSPQTKALMAGIGLSGFLVLLVVCANIASLLLGRSALRERDISVRISMGASRSRILRMLVAEGLSLSFTACLAAWPLTRSVTGLIGALWPPLASGAHLQFDFAPDARVFVYGVVLSILATLTFTLAPAYTLWRRQISPFIKAGEHFVIRGNSRLVSALVITQIALCALLVTIGSLAYRSLFYIDTSDLYFNKGQLLLAEVNTAGAATHPEQNGTLLERMRQRLSIIPGVAAVSWATGAPPRDHGWVDLPVESTDSGRATVTDGAFVGPDYLEALGVPILTGRDISAADVEGSRSVAVVNRKLADRLWPGGSALGRTLRLGEGAPAEVVGVVPNGAFSGVRNNGSIAGIGKAERPNFVFVPEQRYTSVPGAKTFHIRYQHDLASLIPEIRAAVHDVDDRVPVYSVRTMDEDFQDFIAPIRIVTTLIGLFAASSLFLSSIGLYAAIAFHTTSRTREFGIRAALGGTPWQVLSGVLKRGLALTGVGVAAGLTIAAAVAKTLSGLLFGVDPTDAMTYTAVIVLLGVISLAACYLPARRASRIDPMSALRQE